jgi:HAD superfamily hydrolase (TIGR01450 family)
LSQSPASLRNIRHVALDLDGTIYSGHRLFDTVRPFLATLDGLQVGHTFVTNNSSKSSRDYLSRLHALGIDAQPHEIYTSGDATVEYLAEERPDVERFFLLGTPSLARQFSDAGYGLCDDSPHDVPELVVVGFDMGLTYSRLCRAAYWIARGVPYIATHLDRVCPTDEPTFLVDCGAICAALEHATGRKPELALGKPDRRMLRGILNRHGVRPTELAMVGDRLYTDVRMAKETGALGVLVLTGETMPEQIAKAADPPDLVVQDLNELRQLFETR